MRLLLRLCLSSAKASSRRSCTAALTFHPVQTIAPLVTAASSINSCPHSHLFVPRCDRHCADAIMRATHASSFSGDTFAPISRLLGEVLVARMTQVYPTSPVLDSVFFSANSHASQFSILIRVQLLPYLCADVLDVAMPQLTAAALRLSQVVIGMQSWPKLYPTWRMTRDAWAGPSLRVTD